MADLALTKRTSCDCHAIHQWAQKNRGDSGWGGLNPLTRQLWRLKRGKWTIRPAIKLAASAKSRKCQTCVLLYRVIDQLGTAWRDIRAIHLEVSNAIGQLKVTLEPAEKSASRQVLYLNHPEGMCEVD